MLSSVHNSTELFVQELPPLELHYVPYLWRRAWDPDVDGMLSGTGASVFVHDLYGETTLQPWDPAVRGSPGYQTGAAYVYQRNGESWQQVWPRVLLLAP